MHLNLIDLFSSILPSEAIKSSVEDLQFYGKDSCKEFTSNASLVLLPSTPTQVQQIISICNANKIKLVPSGGRTGYSGGATAANGEVVLSTDRLNKIYGVNRVDRTIHCQAGVTTEAVQTAAQTAGLYYPVDFASRGSSQIGGNIATNAGGIRVIRYGSTRDWVLGLTVVTGAGEVLTLNGPLFKNQTGYDLRSLFVGSEGTLGVITEAILKLTQPEGETVCFLAGFDGTTQVVQALGDLRNSGLQICLFEYFDHNCFTLVAEKRNRRSPFNKNYLAYAVVEIETDQRNSLDSIETTLSKLLDDNLIAEIIVASSLKQRKDLLAWREDISATINQFHIPHKNDISVPICSIPEFISKLQVELLNLYPQWSVLIFGHIGDGNLHVNAIKPDNLSQIEFRRLTHTADQQLFKTVQDLGGSISAEHGVGLLKRDYLGYSRSASEIEIMRKLKDLLDPNGILNPGKIFENLQSIE